MRTRIVNGLLLLFAFAVLLATAPVEAGQTSEYKVLAPIEENGLTIWPVVAADVYDTSRFITLDEGLRSGEVVVTEAGRAIPLRRGRTPMPPGDGAQVNRLVLVNNSDRPLLLLAGEVVTGGKQDRVVGKDRIVPPQSDPVDLSVFCVEPGRWAATSETFAGLSNQLAQPSVRAKAMADKDQNAVWDNVRASQRVMVENVQAAAPAIAGTSSYAKVMENREVQETVDRVAKPIERSYSALMRQLRDRRAVGVVVALGGRIIWADVFASTDLLERYWPKLVRSYAAEAVTISARPERPSISEAQRFVDEMNGRREVAETEPGVFRHSEITGDGYKVFELTSLLPKTNYEIHVAKMSDWHIVEPYKVHPMIRR